MRRGAGVGCNQDRGAGIGYDFDQPLVAGFLLAPACDKVPRKVKDGKSCLYAWVDADDYVYAITAISGAFHIF